ncbi:MAG: hypothetical protein JNK85_17580, partial [Verrucomicrobiales bacterium]|nr:hypothetical protein [Verrucomicrobiales bacterium]
MTLSVSRTEATQAVFRVTLSERSTQAVTIDYATRDDSARAGEDYIAKSGSLEFAAGETEILLAVPVAANARDEVEESFLVDFLRPTNAALMTPSARATLVPALPSNRPPQLLLLSPAPPFSYRSDSPILMEVDATDPDQDALTVAITIDDVWRVQILEPPYRWFWTNVTPGSHTLSVQVTDALGMTSAITPVSFTVETASNAPPVVKLLSPGHHSVHALNDSVRFAAEVNDPEGSIAQVEFFAHQTRVGVVRKAPFEFIWTNPPPGDVRCFARATDARGATADSAAATIGITEVCGQVALLRRAPEIEIRTMVEALFELGVPSQIFEPGQVTAAQLTPFDLVIWNDGGIAPLDERLVRLFQSLAESGKSLYFVGDHLLSDLARLDATGQGVWTQLLRLEPGASVETTNLIQFRHDHTLASVEHPLLHGKAGSIPDFDYPFPPETTRLASLGNEVVLGERHGHPVLVAVASPDLPSGRRQITQAFPVGGGNIDSLVPRQRLFQNAVWWLLRCPPCEDFNLVPTLRSSTESPMAGQVFELILEGSVSPDCDGLAALVHCDVPADWEFAGVRTDQGTWEQSGKRITLNLGRLPRGSLVAAQIQVRPRLDGPQPVQVRWATLNEGPAAIADNTLYATVFVENGLRLILRPSSDGQLELEVLGMAASVPVIETALAVSGPWTLFTNLPSTGGTPPAQWRFPVDSRHVSRFY